MCETVHRPTSSKEWHDDQVFERRVQHWPLAAPPADYVLGHVRAVLPDGVIDDAVVAVRGGVIAGVEPHRPGLSADVDGEGLLCIPGLVDTHSDGLEKERLPRPGAELPMEFALLSFEGKLRAAGVTTVFHGAGFEQSMGRGTPPHCQGRRSSSATPSRAGPMAWLITGSCTGSTCAARKALSRFRIG